VQAALADALNALRPLGNIFASLWDVVQKFARDPLGFVRDNMIAPLWGGLQWLATKIAEGFAWIAAQLQPLAKAVVDALAGAAQWLGNLAMSVVDAVASAARGFADSVSKTVSNIYRWMVDAATVPIKAAAEALGTLKELVGNVFKGLGISSPPYLTVENTLAALATGSAWSSLFYISSILMQLPVRAISFALKGLASVVTNAIEHVEISIRPFGLGGNVRFSIGKALGGAIWTSAEELDGVVKKWAEYSAMGMLFWYGQTISRLVTFNLRNYIPIEIPSLGESFEIARRAQYAEKLPPELGKGFRDVMDGLRYYLAVRGFSDFVVKAAFASEDEYYTIIKDRFGVERKIPLALWYTLPTPSEAISMVIRDLVIPPGAGAEDVLKTVERLMGIRGMPTDVAKLFYIYHFRYPSPETLARFYWRGLAGTLWVRDTLEEPAIRSALKVPESWKAKAPVDLNFDAQSLNRMMSLYLKWHDYFPAPWDNNLPTDKAIVLETLADLPTRIDLRWLTRWGIFEHLTKIGFSISTPIPQLKDFMKRATGEETRSDKVSPEIALDVSLLARMLIATGYHPDYVPALAVAQSHQIITDELTLTRTGFIEAYRRGLITLDTSEKLMSGLFKVKFTTATIDPSTGKPDVFTYVKPVFWLPAERRLLQLRSIFDRYTIVMRTLIGDVTRLVRRLAIYPDEGIGFIRDLFTIVSEQWGKEVKAVNRCGLEA